LADDACHDLADDERDDQAERDQEPLCVRVFLDRVCMTGV
jgi:hypothetical protein